MFKYFRLSENEKEFLYFLKKQKGLDKHYYRFAKSKQNRYSRSLANYLFPERHFVVKGQYFARKPFENYEPFEYDDYLFLAENIEQSGYHAYLKNMHIEKEAICKTQGFTYEKLNEIHNKYQNIVFEPKTTKRKIAVVVHLYYMDLLDELLSSLQSLPYEYDLYITVNDAATPQQRKLIEQRAKKFDSTAFIAYVPNHGRDIFPFLLLINHNMLDNYEAILKIHSKKKAHARQTGEMNRKLLIKSITPPVLKPEELEKFIGSRRAAILVCEYFIFGKEHWLINKKHVFTLLGRLDLHIDEKALVFPAESIYWIKNSITDELKRLELTTFDFPLEKGRNDGETAHAIERLIGCICVAKGLEQWGV